jgi:hypothetical protein
VGTDIVNRGYRDLLGTCDFLGTKRITSVACNPPRGQ